MISVIKNATIVNENAELCADIVIEDGFIADIVPEGVNNALYPAFDASNCLVLPGVIDTHVHFREPGMTDKADIWSESRAAAAGGVTSFFDMPNTIPQTTTTEAWRQKADIAERNSAVNYNFYFGATDNNIDSIKHLNPLHICGVKVFMGSSTGNMLVDNENVLYDIFSSTNLPIVTHCEDTNIIKKNEQRIRSLQGDNPDIHFHSVIRSEEACCVSTALAIKIAEQTKAKLHVAHVSTARELDMFNVNSTHITAEVCLPHLMFCDKDYDTLNALIKCNPAIKTTTDRDALLRGLTNGKITTVATDHAPHLLRDKQGGALQAASGMPFVQFSLMAMLSLCDRGILPVTRVVALMSHNPARLFNVNKRGFIRIGCYADLAIVKKSENKTTLHSKNILSKCKWSPLEGQQFAWNIIRTYCNGVCVYDSRNGINNKAHGMEITFNR